MKMHLLPPKSLKHGKKNFLHLKNILIESVYFEAIKKWELFFLMTRENDDVFCDLYSREFLVTTS